MTDPNPSSKSVRISGFRDFGDTDFYRWSDVVDLPAGHSESWFGFTEDVYVAGGAYYMDTGFTAFVDKLQFQITDKDNILGYGADLVLKQFLEDEFISPDGNGEIEIEDGALLPSTLYFKVIADVQNACKMLVRFYLRR